MRPPAPRRGSTRGGTDPLTASGAERARANADVEAAMIVTAGSAPERTQPIPSHDLTLEPVLSAPFLPGLTAAPTGGRAARVFDGAGIRIICIAERRPDGPYQSRPVTTYEAHDLLHERSWSILFAGTDDLFPRHLAPGPSHATSKP